MIKLLIAGIWVCVVTLGSTYMALHWKRTQAAADNEAHHPVLVHVTPAPITVPVVTGGAVAGYVIAQFSYSVDKEQLKGEESIMEPVIKDQSFRTIYGGEAGDFKKPKKADLERLSAVLLAAINKRLNGDVVKDVLIEELVFVPKDKTRGGGGALQKKKLAADH